MRKVMCVCAMSLLVTFANAENFRFQSSDGADSPAFKAQAKLFAKISKDTKGKVNVKLLPSGSLVEHDKTLQAIGQGALDGHVTATGYFYKVDPALGLLGNSVGAWSDPKQLLDFMNNGGGNDVIRKIYKPLGVYFIGATAPGLEAFVSSVPLNGVKDLKGLKMRAPAGMIFDTFKAAGAKPFNIPGGDVKKALANGIIQASDFTVFYGNQAAGLNKVAKHPVYPGFHSLPLVEISMNSKKWNSLSKKDKAIFKKDVKAYAKKLVADGNKKDKKAIKEAKKQGVTIHNWSKAERAKFRKIAQGEWKKFSKKSKNAKIVYDKLVGYLKSKHLM